MVHLLASMVLLRSLMNHSHVKSFHASIILIVLLKRSVISFWLLSRSSIFDVFFLFSTMCPDTDLFFYLSCSLKFRCKHPNCLLSISTRQSKGFYTCHIHEPLKSPAPSLAPVAIFLYQKGQLIFVSQIENISQVLLASLLTFKVYSNPQP